MTDRNRTQKHSSALRYFKGAFVILLAAAWLTFVIFYWQQRSPFFRMIDASYVSWLRNNLDAQNFFAVSVYLHVAPPVFLFYMLSVLLPKAADGLSQKADIALKIIAALLMITGVLAAICSCTTLPEYAKDVLPAIQVDSLVYYSDLIYLYITPVCLILCMILTVIMLSAKKGRSRNSFVFLSLFVSVLLGIMIAAASCLIITALKPVLPALSIQIESFCCLLATSGSMLFVAVILAPLIEETAFRGLIQHHISACFNPVSAVLLASIAFGLWHRNLGQFIYTFLFGLITGSVYEITGRLHHCILIHFFMNFTAVLAFSDVGNGIIPNLNVITGIRQNMMSLSPATAAVFAVLLIGAMIALLIMLRHYAHRKDS